MKFFRNKNCNREARMLRDFVLTRFHK